MRTVVAPTPACGGVLAVAAGWLPDGTPVIISASGGSGSGSGSLDGAVRVRRLADGTPVGEALELPGSACGIAVNGNIIVTADGTDIAVHQLTLPGPIR